MVKLAHTLFALPFALAAAAMAATEHGWDGPRLGWILVAMFGARNAAMGFNRLIDRRFDAENPRTADREIPAGRLSAGFVLAISLALSALFVFASFRLGPLCGWLSPVALAIVVGYSYTKRFTWACHLWLGLALAIAPVGAWLAIAGSFSATAWLLGAAVAFWVAGFDVIYACQDAEFDRRHGLHSIPARFGVARALLLARLFHLVAFAALVAVGLVAGLHPLYWLGCLAIAGIMAWEHRIVRADDLSRVGVAFFNLNGSISVLYLIVTLAALYAPRFLGRG